MESVGFLCGTPGYCRGGQFGRDGNGRLRRVELSCNFQLVMLVTMAITRMFYSLCDSFKTNENLLTCVFVVGSS